MTRISPGSMMLLVATAALLISVLGGCRAEEDLSRKTDAELHLTAEQARGRQLYNVHCAQCHYAYKRGDLHGPTMKGVFQKQYMPSGTPANDDRVRDVIVYGKGIMPGSGRGLDEQRVRELIAYMHTL